MKKVLLTLLAGILISSISFSQTKKTIKVDDFTSVSFGVSGNLTLEQGNSFKVVFEGDEDLLEEVTAKVSNGKLVIRKPNWRKARNKKLKAHIILPELTGAFVSGSGDITNKGGIECDDVSFAVSGSGQIVFDNFSADRVKMSISGSGGLKLDGAGASAADISISGSGSVSAEEFKVDRAEIGISGSGRCKLWVEDALRARVSGSGNIYVKGDPNIDAKSSGSGKVRKF